VFVIIGEKQRVRERRRRKRKYMISIREGKKEVSYI